MVLLKNDGGILPLDSASIRTIAVVGPYAVRPSTGGGGSSHVIPLYTITPYDGLNAGLGLQIQARCWTAATSMTPLRRPSMSQVAIVMVGDEDSEGHDQSLELPPAQNQLIERSPRPIRRRSSW